MRVYFSFIGEYNEKPYHGCGSDYTNCFRDLKTGKGYIKRLKNFTCYKNKTIGVNEKMHAVIISDIFNNVLYFENVSNKFNDGEILKEFLHN